jgi:hypothetical protein
MRQKEAPKRHDKGIGKGQEWMGKWWWIVRGMGVF